MTTPLFLTVKLKLGHNFSYFILKFKIRIFECWSYGSFIYDVRKEGGGFEILENYPDSYGWYS